MPDVETVFEYATCVDLHVADYFELLLIILLQIFGNLIKKKFFRVLSALNFLLIF